MNLNKIASALFILIAVYVILIYSKTILIPFVLALIIWFVIRQINTILNRVEWIKRTIPRWLKNLISSLVIFAVAGLIIKLLFVNIQVLSNSLGNYQSNINIIIEQLNTKFNIDVLELSKNYSSNLNYSSILSMLFGGLTELFSNSFLVPIYLLFLLIEETYFNLKLQAIYKNEERYNKIKATLSQINHSISNYIGVKTLTSLMTAFVSFVILYFVDIDAPIFWAFLIFLFNFIPNIGSLIATLFPAIFSLFQFGGDALSPFLIIIFGVGCIQFLVGSILEPRLMGNSLNISSLVVMLSLALWGVIWGVIGMILSVPITVMMIIVFSKFKESKSIAVLLSEKGQLDTE